MLVVNAKNEEYEKEKWAAGIIDRVLEPRGQG
jgi:hypothetical protein